jgi:hypothetical protein
MRLVGFSGIRNRGEAPPPRMAPKSKTNLRSALESAKRAKNEPETNPNEPERASEEITQALENL